MVEDETAAVEVENEREFSGGGRWWRVREEETDGGIIGSIESNVFGENGLCGIGGRW